MQAERGSLEAKMGQPGFWNDKEQAREIVGKLKSLKGTLEPFEAILAAVEDLPVLLEIAEEERDAEALGEFDRECGKAEQALGKFEFRQMLDGADDSRNAYLSIHAGAGGTESCDWAEMLLRMYSHWCERSGYDQEIVAIQPGEEAGLRRVTVHAQGEWAFGYLKAEIGVHRLVRISPFDANKRRHTSFASVDVVPEVSDDVEIEIKEKDIKMDTYRASGAGGQHVNKTSSAVRLTHIPSGVVVQCQNERSQFKNRGTAMKMLKAKLYQIEETKKRAELAAAYDEKGEIAWGNQIRSYVLQPYTMVKDLRTNCETSNVEAVLNGDIDAFLEAYLKHKMGRE